jgi:hypothetical protein
MCRNHSSLLKGENLVLVVIQSISELMSLLWNQIPKLLKENKANQVCDIYKGSNVLPFQSKTVPANNTTIGCSELNTLWFTLYILQPLRDIEIVIPLHIHTTNLKITTKRIAFTLKY